MIWRGFRVVGGPCNLGETKLRPKLRNLGRDVAIISLGRRGCSAVFRNSYKMKIFKDEPVQKKESNGQILLPTGGEREIGQAGPL